MSTTQPSASGAPQPFKDDDEGGRQGVSRLVTFSDGLFAFAMTLLIINILPYASLGKAASDVAMLTSLLSPTFLTSLFSFVISFYIIGLTWQSHRWLFRYVIRLDATMFILDLTLLLLVAFLPFPTDLLGQHLSPLTAALFSGTLALIRLLQAVLWWNASAHRRLLSPTLDDRTIAFIGWRVCFPLPFYVVAIGLAFINPLLAIASWVTALISLRFVDRRFGVAEW